MPRRPRFHDRRWIHVLLFVLTLATTTLSGACHYEAFISDFGAREIPVRLDSAFLLRGLWYSLTLLAILGAHEMGHYVMCRRHQVDATLPFFLPAPLPLTGTIGAFIKIREAFPSKPVLFDIGVAGPIAGFVVLVPALFIGLGLSNVAPLPADFVGFSLGEPLLFQWATELVWGPIPDGASLNMHPMVFAAWFGLFATALNLLPFGQLDGGHIAYAALGRWASGVSVATVAVAIALTYQSASWIVVTVMMVLMLLVFGPRHPHVLDEYTPLTPGRRLIALAAAVIFVICFTPAPIEPYDLIRNP
jgi:membrane-associated protease RseP (regulator of RpoE activity)